MQSNKKDMIRKFIRTASAWRHRLPWGSEAQLQKYDIVNILARKHGYQRYLEICTPTTGWKFAKIDKRAFQVCHRLIYRCPDDFEDGQEINFRSRGESSENLLDPRFKYDVVFVDPWHTFDCSLRDLHLGLAALAEGATMVVHDCCPAEAECVTPQYKEGGWCGVTYCAYVDFLLGRSDLVYCTVNTDFGCGVVRRRRQGEKWMPACELTDKIKGEWRQRRSQSLDTFDFFRAHRRELLNLVSAQEFLEAENLPSPLRVRLGRPFRATAEI
jgi:hypothetical protein